MSPIRVPDFFWKIKGSLKSLSLEIYAFIVREDVVTLLQRSDSFAPRGPTDPPAKAGSTADTRAVKGSSKSNASAGSNTKSGANTQSKANTSSGTTGKGTPAPQTVRHRRPANQ